MLTPGTLLILLPPSEGKAAGGDGPPLNLGSLSFESLNSTRVRMVKALVELSTKPRVSKRLLGVKGTALEQAMADNAGIESSPTMPAIKRYTGVMYDAIGYRSLADDAREVFDQNVVVMSGLFGMLRPQDMVPAYKLKMGAALMRGRSCAAAWKPLVTKSLTGLAEGGVIWDLLPIEHSAAWEPSAVPCNARFTVKFLERTPDGGTKTVSHLSKLLKGALVRHIVSNPAEAGSAESALELLEGFSLPEGYKFSPEMTSEQAGATEIVFLKR